MGVGEEMPQHLSRQIVSCILLDSLCGPYRNWAPVVTLATNIFYWLSSLFSSLADSYTLFIGTIYQRNHLQLQCCLRIYFWKPKLRYLNYKVLVFLFSGVFSFEYFLSFLLEHLRNELFCWLFEKIFFFFHFLTQGFFLPLANWKMSVPEGPTVTKDKVSLNILCPHHISASGKSQNGRDNYLDFWNNKADNFIRLHINMNLFFQTLFTSPISDFVLIVDFFWYQLFYPYLFSFWNIWLIRRDHR